MALKTGPWKTQFSSYLLEGYKIAKGKKRKIRAQKPLK